MGDDMSWYAYHDVGIPIETPNEEDLEELKKMARKLNYEVVIKQHGHVIELYHEGDLEAPETLTSLGHKPEPIMREVYGEKIEIKMPHTRGMYEANTRESLQSLLEAVDFVVKINGKPRKLRPGDIDKLLWIWKNEIDLDETEE